MIKSIILVGLGGGIGSIVRYLTYLFVTKHFQTAFPLATFSVNILGSLLIGLFIGFFERQHIASPELKYLFIIGFCGGFTTFSSFAAENVNLLQSGSSLTSFIYTAASVVLSIFAVWLGIAFAK